MEEQHLEPSSQKLIGFLGGRTQPSSPFGCWETEAEGLKEVWLFQKCLLSP